MPVRRDDDVKAVKTTRKDAMRAALDNTVEVPTVEPKAKTSSKAKAKTTSKKLTKTKPVSKAGAKKAKTGKSSNPDFQQTTVYINKHTLLNVKMTLLQEDKDLSELIEELLQKHIAKS